MIMVSQGYSLTFWIGLALVILGILFLLYLGAWRLWFSNRDWKFRTSDDRTLWRKYFDFHNKHPVLWESGYQKIGMFYEIDLKRVRGIAKIWFSCGKVCKLPLKSCFLFLSDDADMRIEKENKYPESSDMVELKPPFKARYINMRIVEIEPDGKHTWRVEAIYVQVKTLFGLKHTIGRYWLDAL